MKVLTWNINGIRGNKGLPLKQLLDSLDADIICLQETKVSRKIVLKRIQFYSHLDQRLALLVP